MPVSRRTLCTLLVAGVSTAHAAPLPAPLMCTMSASVVALRVVDAQGHPVKGAQIQLRRLATGTWLPHAGPMGDQGDYKLLEDADLPDLQRAGEDFEVRLQKDQRSRVLRLRIGMDRQGCHIQLLQGDARVVL